ncbi:MAG: VanZ family protein [Clostridia bacterium]|nr:VanZ family protein [Clostridia bacterium]
MKIKGNKIGFYIFTVLSLLFAILIFLFSYQSAEQSSGVSVSFYDIFIDFTGFDFISHGAFRKIAHFCEFAALGFCVSGSVYFYCNRPNLLKSIVPCIIYAISDEVHQMFVPERAGRIFDVFVDSCGSIFGLSVFLLIVFIYNKIKK